MRKQIWVFFFLFTTTATGVSQFNEDFSDRNLTIHPQWVGDLDDFRITDDKILQLSANGKSESSIYTSIFPSQSWSLTMWFKLDFNPSFQNRLDIIIWSSQKQITKDSTLFLRIGEVGNNDAIQIVEQFNGTQTILGTATMGKVATGPVEVRFKLHFGESDLWTLETDYNGGSFFVPEIEFIPRLDVRNLPGFFGLRCLYSQTRNNKFFFDNIYTGIATIDSLPPKIVQFDVVKNRIHLTFNEILDSSIVNSERFQILPESINLEGVHHKISKGTIELFFESEFLEQTLYSLFVKQIEDLTMNRLDTVITFMIPSEPDPGDLIINEILFNPFPGGVDFVECINKTDKFLNLNRLSLGNNQNDIYIALKTYGVIGPHEIIAFTEKKNDLIGRYPSSIDENIKEIKLPKYNDDNGNVIIIDEDNTIIDLFDYDASFHNVFLDDVEGISLERVSINATTQDRSNWSSSSSISGFATPGAPNSQSNFNVQNNDGFKLRSKVFSPDSDGYEDFLIIEYTLSEKDNLANVFVFNSAGFLVRNLGKGITLGANGSLKWDGTGDNGVLQNTGLYIIVVDVFSASGNRDVIKLTAILANHFD